MAAHGYAGARDYLARLYDAGVVPEGTTRCIIVADIREAVVYVYTQAVADGGLLDVTLHPLGVQLVRLGADGLPTAGESGDAPAVHPQDAGP